MIWFRRIFALCVGLILFVGSWYAVGRFLAKSASVGQQHIDSVPMPSNRPSAKTIRVAAYNIAHGRGNAQNAPNAKSGDKKERADRLAAIAAAIKEDNLDLVILNEVDFDTSWSHRVNQARLIADLAGFPHVVEQRNIDATLPWQTYRFGNAVLSKLPVHTIEHIALTPLSKFENAFAGNHDAVYCEVSLPNARKIGIVGVHLEVRSEEIRVKAAEQLITFARAHSHPMIVAGDFNSTPLEYISPQIAHHFKDAEGRNAMNAFFDAGFTTLPPLSRLPHPNELTFPTSEPNRIIDWILVSKSLQVRNQWVRPLPLSDHAFIGAEIAFEDALPNQFDVNVFSIPQKVLDLGSDGIERQLRQHLENEGVHFPNGSQLILGPQQQTVVIRTEPAVLRHIASILAIVE